jgi:hypothetical protein
MATLVLRTVKGSPLTNLEVDGNFSNINTEVGVVYNTANTINSNVGVLSNLTTTATSNLVAAINEIASESTSSVGITGGNISGVTLSFLTSDDTTTNSTFFPTFQTASTGNAAIKISSSKFTFNPSSGLLSSTDYNSSSDISLKQDFVPISNSLDIIGKLNGFGFTWKDSKEKSYGLSAQEVEQVIPEIVRTRSDGFKGINYMNLTAFLVEAIKDLKLEIQELKKHK